MSGVCASETLDGRLETTKAVTRPASRGRTTKTVDSWPPWQRRLHQYARIASLYLQPEISGINAALRETAGDKPEARLSGAGEHVAQLLFITESPDRANADRNIIAEQFPNQIFLTFVARRQNDQIGGKHFAGAHSRSLYDEGGDVGELHQPDFALNDQIGAADIEIVAATTGEILELPARSVLTEIKFESHPPEPIEQVLVEILRFFGEEDVAFLCQ